MKLPDTPAAGDLLIRPAGDGVELVLLWTYQRIAYAPTVEGVYTAAAARRSAVWREQINDRGMAIGRPRLLLIACQADTSAS